MPLRSLQGVPVRDQHRLKLTFPFMGIPDANMRVHCADVFREVLTVVVATFSLPPGSYSLIWYVEGPTDLPHRDVSRLLLAPNETPALVEMEWSEVEYVMVERVGGPLRAQVGGDNDGDPGDEEEDDQEDDQEGDDDVCKKEQG